MKEAGEILILLIEDDKSICAFISNCLTSNGYQVLCSHTGVDGLNLFTSRHPDIVLLDLGLPDMDGCQILKILRQISRIPVIILSARNKEEDKVTALDLGADDYLTKPFGTAELMARIRTSLRHYDKLSIPKTYQYKDLHINYESREVLLRGEEIHLTQVEYQILAMLSENAGHVLTYKSMLNAIWGPFMAYDNQILRVNMANIRRKIESNPAMPDYLFTEIGVGYRMPDNEID